MQIRANMMYLQFNTPSNANPSLTDAFTILYALQCKYEHTWCIYCIILVRPSMQIRVKMMYLLVYTPFSANPSLNDVDLFTVLYAR